GVPLDTAVEDDVLDPLAELEDLVVQRCVREAEVDPDVVTVEYREARVQLRARVLDAAEVVPERLGQPQRAGEAALNERILRPLVEVGEVEPDAAIEEADLEAGFPLRRLLGLQVQI